MKQSDIFNYMLNRSYFSKLINSFVVILVQYGQVDGEINIAFSITYHYKLKCIYSLFLTARSKLILYRSFLCILFLYCSDKS